MGVVTGMTPSDIDSESKTSPLFRKQYNNIGLARGDMSRILMTVLGFALAVAVFGVVVASTDSSILSDLTKQEVSAPVE